MGEDDVLQVILHSEAAQAPVRATPESAGYDLFSVVNQVISPGTGASIATDVQVILPPGCYGRIADRSSIALKHSTHVLGGVIDADYCGKIAVILFNHGKVNYEVEKGARIAQLICEKISTPGVRVVTTNVTSKRGTGGFGSTGV